MGLYRASSADGVAWVTGASSGIGRHAAWLLARQGYVVAVTARSEQKLAALADEARDLAGRIVPFACDLTDEDAALRAVTAIESELGPVVLAILNAGTYFPTTIERLDIKHFVNTYQINIFGTVHCMVPLIERMRQAGRGQIVLTGSVTGYVGMPTTAAYGASKAALNNMVWSLKHDLDKLNIRIQIVNPGFIDTPMTAKLRFPMPALMPVEAAAERVLRAVRAGGVETTFPRRFTWLIKLVDYLPVQAAYFVINRVTGWNKRSLKSQREGRQPETRVS